jgi:hypothetical protein
VEVDGVDLPPSAEEREVGDGLGELEGDGGAEADGEIEFAVGAAPGHPQLPLGGGDMSQRDDHVGTGGSPEP